MFLKASLRCKDGKVHVYWSPMEIVRFGQRVFQRHGYSRDKRGDCLQVVVALMLMPDGFPLAYEVHPGNISDKGARWHSSARSRPSMERSATSG